MIYHNGAVLNFAYTYEVLRESNVRGTHEIIRLAMQRRLKPVHYVSTVAVLASSRRGSFDVVKEDDPLPPISSLRDAYSQTKWMSERLIAVARGMGFPVTIYRPSGVTGHSKTGRSNVGDLIHVMALGCYQMGTIPHLDVEFNLVPVDFVAAALVEISQQSDSPGKVFHLVNPDTLRLDDFVQWVQDAQLPGRSDALRALARSSDQAGGNGTVGHLWTADTFLHARRDFRRLAGGHTARAAGSLRLPSHAAGLGRQPPRVSDRG